MRVSTGIGSILFLLCIVIPTFNNYELSFLVWAIAAFITVKNQYSVYLLKNLIPPILILLVAFFASFFSEWEWYPFVRDIAYLLKPIFGLLVGYQLAKSIPGIKPFVLLVQAGALLAALHFGRIVFTFLFLDYVNMHDFRGHAGYFSDFEVYAFVILLFSSRFDLNFSRKTRIWLLVLLGLSIFLYLARTNFIQLAILLMAMAGYLRLTRRAVVAFCWTAVVVIGLYSIVYHSDPRREAAGFEAFLYKVKIAPIEPFKLKIDKTDWRDFHDNYRSYENIITVQQVSEDGIAKVIMGQGLGSHVDLRREIWTNDHEMIRYLPALHNSYMTIFLKSGLIGVFLLFVSIYILIRQLKIEQRYPQSINRLLIGTAVFLILSNWVFMGLYFKVDNKSVLIGFLICCRELYLRRQREPESRDLSA